MKTITNLALVGLTMGLATTTTAQELVTNGSFEQTTNGPGQLGWGTDAVGWDSGSSTGYNYVYAPGTADTTGSHSYQFNFNLTMWGSNNGGINVFPATSPDGGNFVAADGGFETVPITQTINGLTVGQDYQLSFYYGASQQAGFDGDTGDNWTVGLGSQSFTTPTINNPSHGFSGWFSQTFIYTAISSSETLSFLASGTPNGQPPFSLLDGVSLTAVTPEPTATVALFAGLIGFGVFARRRGRALKAVS